MIQRSEKSIKVWDAYGELFTLYCTQNNLKLDALGKVLTEDAKQHASVRCKYSKRSLELYKVKPKTGRKYREMRPYRREHLHVFFSEYLRDCGKAHEYADYLAAIAPPSEDGLATACTSNTTEATKGKSSSAAIEEKSYFKYYTQSSPLLHSDKLIDHLEERYKCTAFTHAGVRYPVTILWKNTSRDDHGQYAQSVLGTLESEEVVCIERSPILSPEEYSAARLLLKETLEDERNPEEAMNYTMTRIENTRGGPRIHGAVGWYYDNLLTQIAMEWELTKSLLTYGASGIARLRNRGALPLREAMEAQCTNPLWEGTGRCASLAVCTLLVYQKDGEHWYLLRRRSKKVAIKQRMLHVVPASMFDALNLNDKWSIENNTWRELLEEVYDERREQSSVARLYDHMLTISPIPWLKRRLGKSVTLTVTGICCDLLGLRTEICTVLYIRDEKFWSERAAQFNWEYETRAPKGRFAIRWDKLDDTLRDESKRNENPEVDRRGIVPAGAVCVELAREWLQRNFGL